MNLDNFPLRGLRVVSFEQAVAAPLCTRHLADMGADVIKIERRGEGDFARAYDSAVYGSSTWFTWLNRGKRSITLDLKAEDGLRVAEDLVAQADVVVQNFATGAFERLNLGIGQLRERYPALIGASITGYGEDGPYGQRKAYDLLVQAEAGVMSVTGTAEQPSKVGVSLVDLSSGVYTYGAIVTALYRREQTGEGATIRVSLFDSILEWVTPLALMARYGPHPQRSGGHHASVVPYGPYSAGDGDVVLSVQNNREWILLCDEVLDLSDVARDPRFDTNEKRLANRRELEPLVEAALARLGVEEAERRLEKAALAFSRMRDIADVFAHPQAIARDRLLEVAVPGGSARVPRTPLNIEGVEESPGRIPGIGENTDEILAELGYDRSRIETLRADSVV